MLSDDRRIGRQMPLLGRSENNVDVPDGLLAGTYLLPSNILARCPPPLPEPKDFFHA